MFRRRPNKHRFSNNDVNRDAAAVWIDDKARLAGFANGDAFAQHFALKRYRLTQLYRAATRELLSDVGEVSVLSKELRAKLALSGFQFDSVSPIAVQHSKDAQTTKALFALRDSAEVEAVLMEHFGNRNTVCISSQAGCAYGCTFCATGQGGFTRQLSATEIFDQARFFARTLANEGKRITNVVFMGMGEPFANYDAVMGAVSLLNDAHGFGLGQRHITISTVGVVPKIERFADEAVQVNLAISLHASNDELRSQMMPVNRRWNLDALLRACERYVEKTNRKVFFEYVMLDGVNDSATHAHELATLMHGRLYHVNLIPYNATPEGEFKATPDSKIWEFAAILEAAGIPVTVRANMGRDIAAACGQLRAETQPKAHSVSA